MARGRTKKTATATAAVDEIVIGTADGEVLARVPAPVREQVRYLWTRLQVHGGDLPRSIGVTSRSPGEGVSFTSQALAAVLARTGETCLVEANWWGTRLPFREPRPGLAGVLASQVSVADALVQTNHPGLSILPAGELVDTGQAVMANTEAMRAVLAELQSSFRYVVLDLPAITVSAVALSFAAATRGSLLVVRQRSTRIDHVEASIEDLRHTNLLGVVLNGYEVSMPGFLQRRLLEA